jgi:hypothetical protein
MGLEGPTQNTSRGRRNWQVVKVEEAAGSGMGVGQAESGGMPLGEHSRGLLRDAHKFFGTVHKFFDTVGHGVMANQA